MNTYFLKICYALLLLLLHAAGSIHGYNWASTSGAVKCIEKERQALLNFKQGLIDYFGMLSTWRNDENNGNCCEWRGIECNNETGHVEMLYLRGSETLSLSGEINITSLIELQNMEYLDLSYNDFSGNQIPKHMGVFSNLRYLNLSYSNFGGRIPYQLGNLSQLEYLDLNRNSLDGAIPSQLGKLTHLRYLDLSDNYGIDGENLLGIDGEYQFGIDGEIPYQLGNLSQLEYLDLNGNSLDGAIPSQLGNLSQLEYLDLKINSLVGAIPSQLGKLTHLRYLDLSYNLRIDGEIPYQFGNLSQLQYLDLEETSLHGVIPFHGGNLPMLQTLRLSGDSGLKINDAEWLPNLTSLTNLDLRYFNDASSHHWLLQSVNKVLSNLKELRLRRCGLSDNDILSLFESHSNFSTSLSILDLSENMLTSSTFQLLSNFSFYLQELYLLDNNIVMSFPPHLNFPYLVILDLSYNNLTSSIFQGNSNFGSKLRAPSPSIMNSSSSLVILDLSGNLLTSAIFHWLFNFTTNLHTLFLDGNLLEGPIPNGFGKEMNSLEILSMSDNKLQGEIPASLGNICTLRALSLSRNNLSGEMSSFIQNSSWCNRHIFQMLDLSNNRITGLLPKSIGLLYELESLYLEGNSLEGDITELHLTNLSKLKYLDFSDNSLSLKFGTMWVPPFLLFTLGLASCKLGPSFPSWLQTQRYLSFIDISEAGINDSVPMWFWNKLQSIMAMNMSYNNLIGTIPNLPLKLTKLTNGEEILVVLNSNQFEGRIPDFLLQASALDLSKNKISDLNSFLCGKSTTSKMRTLDLSDNEIKGQLSDCWGHLNSLEFLDLSNNKLSGKIPSSMTTLFNLEALVLRNNSFIGELPSTLKNCTNLIILDVGDNLLSGSIPSWIGESLQQLKILSLRVNHFFGTLPSHLCYLRQIHLLDLSRNNFYEKIPTCLSNFTAMLKNSIDSKQIVGGRLLSTKSEYFNIYESNALLTWKGQEYLIKNSEFLLKSIDLSSNHLSGEIPIEFGQLLGLVSLNLSRNNFTGEIPSDIGNLNSLDFLDLSRNHLSGRIPSTLSQIDRLAVLDLSNNSLSGKIPLGTQLQSFDPSSFEGNLDLCGKPLDKSCPEDETPIKHQGPIADIKDDNSVFYEALYMSMGVGFFTGFWGLIGPLLLWRPWRNAYLRFLNKSTNYAHVMVVVNVARCRRWLNG